MKARFVQRVWASLIIGLSVMCAAGWMGMTVGQAQADTVVLNDGTQLEGTIEREGEGYIYLVYTVGDITHTRFITSDQIASIERDAAGEDAVVEDEQAGEDADSSEVTRFAILNFGPPNEWGGDIGSTVGIQISAAAFREVVPMLEKDNVDVVVIRINSGGGMLLELEKFYEVFAEEYKPRFRTVTWIESAISCAAMSPWVLEEMYFMPEGNIGACTAWSGALDAMEGYGLYKLLARMEEISKEAGRDPKIMRSMQIQEPLSCDIDDETGQITWYQSTEGEYLVNEPGKILTLNSQDAMKYGFGMGVADSKEELAEVMGYEEVEWVGKRAADHIDQVMRDADRTEKRLVEAWNKYGIAIEAALAANDEKQRGAMVNLARRKLMELRRMINVNPNFVLMYGLTDEWFEEQDEQLRQLAQL